MDFIFLLQHNTSIILFNNISYGSIELYTKDEVPVLDIEISNSMYIYQGNFNDKTAILHLQQNTHQIQIDIDIIKMRNMYYKDIYYIVLHGLYGLY
ncbi:hypothetical protein Paride_0255 [Pseudomonas phage Paride]|nr:hypothetical protein Deiofobo_0255 [Pseudomonas phage Deifobo]WPK40485.1 hypothetical protein Paride_0255 [Pseudomonas phage Paride]